MTTAPPLIPLMGRTGGETPALDCITSLALLGAARTPPYGRRRYQPVTVI